MVDRPVPPFDPSLALTAPPRRRFGGETYSPKHDDERLSGQLRRVYQVMADGEWYTLDQIAAATGDRSTASISARLRDLRKEEFGAYDIRRKRLGDPKNGLFAYACLGKQGIATKGTGRLF